MWRFTGRPSRLMTMDETLTLRRYNNNLADPLGTQIIDGLRHRGAYEEFEIRCTVQPVSGDDLLQQPEGDRYNEQLYIWVWETSEQPQPNDYVQREGQWYLAMSASYWGSFTQSRIQRVDVGVDRAIGY